MARRYGFLRTAFAAMPAALVLIAGSIPASAQYHYRWGPDAPPPGYSGRIPPQHIEAMVRSLGFTPVAEPRPRGPLWVTHAVDRNGMQVRVLIDSFSGRVIDVLSRPTPPRQVAMVPPPNGPRDYRPYAAPDDEDDGPDYDYRDLPRNQQQLPPRSNLGPRVNERPQTPQGPHVIPYGERDQKVMPQRNSQKKDEPKKKKSAAIEKEKPEKEKKAATPKARPADAPKSAQNMLATVPQRSEMPNDPKNTGTVPPAQGLEVKKDDAPKGVPPVQPPF